MAVAERQSRRLGRWPKRVAWGVPQYVLWVVILAFIVFPMAWIVVTSFKPLDEVYHIPPLWIPDHPTLSIYHDVFWGQGGKTSDWPLYYRNSLIVATSASALTMFFASLAGYGFARLKLRLALPLLVVMLVAQMFPGPSLLIPIFMIIKQMHLYGGLPALIILYTAFALPFTTWMSVGGFRSIPKEIEEAALIDGCSRFQVFVRIALPLSRMGLTTTAMFAFLLSWSEYPFALVLIQHQKWFTVPLGLAKFITEYNIAWNQLAVATVAMGVPMMVAFMFVQRQFVSGLTAGYGKE